MFSIITNQLVRFGVISVENVSLEDLVGSHFTFLIRMSPPTIPDRYQTRKRKRGGHEGRKVGVERGSTTTKVWTDIGYKGVS